MMSCAVFGCVSNYPECGIKFHSLPRNAKQKNIWLSTIKFKSKCYDSAKICSLHFSPEHYNESGRLLKSAIPHNNVDECVMIWHNKNEQPSKDPIEKSMEITRSVTEVEINTDEIPQLCCRICLLQHCKLISLESYGLRTAYEQVTGVSVEHDDGLPRELCVECATLLDKYHRFRDKAIRGDLLLRQICSGEGILTKNSIGRVDRRAYGLQSKLNTTFIPIYEIAETGELIVQELKTEPITNTLKNFNFIDNSDTEIKIKEENQFKDNTENKDIDVLLINNDPDDITLQYPDQNDSYNSDSSDNVPLKTKVSKKPKHKKTKLKTKRKIGTKNENKDSDKPLSNKDKLNQANVKLLNDYFKVTELTMEEQLQCHEEKKNKDNYLYNEYKCDICYKGYQNEMSFKSHMSLHSEDKGEHRCKICKRRFSSRFKMIGHHRITHMFRYDCLKCSEVFIRRYAAIIHAKWHEGNNYNCEQCGATYQKKTSLLTHMRIKHPSNNACSYCGLSYLGAKGLEAHINLRHSDDVQREITGPWCSECGIQFISPEVLQIHNGVKHSHIFNNKRNETKYPNAILNTSIKQRRKNFPVPCEACGEEMRDGREYYQHFRNRHPDLTRTKYPDRKKQHMCDKCSRQFSNATHLREHLLEHGSECPYRCGRCDKSYKNTLKLKAHLRTHDDPKYPCPVCRKMFTSKYNRDKHYKYVHPNADLEKAKCEICLKEFQSKWTLHFHNKHVHQNVPWPKRNRNKNRVDM